MQQRNPTMNDVAREARVALKTVSRFVNGETNIDPVLGGRIQEAIVSLGYRRNLAAASLRPGWTSRTIGLITSDLANPYYSALARSIEEVADAAGYLLITASSEENGSRHDRLVERLMGQRVDGLIVVPPRDPGQDWSTVTPPVPPLVFLDRPAEFDQADIVIADNRGGARDAVQALLAAGAKRVAFVGDSLDIYTMGERHAGYRDAVGMSRVASDLVATTARTREQSTEAVASLLRAGTADAVFAANNRSAIGALIAFREAGRVLPLIGFDDFEAAPLVSPPVSVVSQDIDLMGRTAAEALLRRIHEPEAEYSTQVLPTKLVLRGSELS